MECRVRHWPHQCRNNLLLWSRISSISKDFKQLLHSERTVSYWSVGYYTHLVQFGCFSMRQGLDLGVRYSRISFLCLFRTDRPTYIISISKETTVLNKIKLILSKRNSNNDLDPKDHYLNLGFNPDVWKIPSDVCALSGVSLLSEFCPEFCKKVCPMSVCPDFSFSILTAVRILSEFSNIKTVRCLSVRSDKDETEVSGVSVSFRWRLVQPD